jgi:hypothetical protein
MSEPYHCSTCGQYVIYHSGLEKVMNYADGFGGKKGEPHSHVKERKGTECNRCGFIYDPEKYYQCYQCFRQICQKCGYMFIWSHKQNRCSRCRNMLSKMITLTIYDPVKGKYVKKDSTFINFEILQILEEFEEIEKINNTK